MSKPRPTHAPPADAEAEREFAEGMVSNLLHCRELGHAWSAYTASYDNTTQTYHRTIMCDSCRCERRQVLDAVGEVVKNGYSYPDGYLASGVIGYVGGKVPRRVFRLAAVNRMVAPSKPRKRLNSV